VSVLDELPCCHTWAIERLLPVGVQMHCAEGRCVEEGGAELALVTDDRIDGGIWQNRTRRGVATLRPDDDVPVIEWSDTSQGAIASFGRALKRVGWTGAPTLCAMVYGGAS